VERVLDDSAPAFCEDRASANQPYLADCSALSSTHRIKFANYGTLDPPFAPEWMLLRGWAVGGGEAMAG
jgi:hypothetical protein